MFPNPCGDAWTGAGGFVGADRDVRGGGCGAGVGDGAVSATPPGTIAPASAMVNSVPTQGWVEKGRFDELVARFADGIVHVETMHKGGVYIGFYCDDGRGHQLWISANKGRLTYHTEDASGPATPSQTERGE